MREKREVSAPVKVSLAGINGTKEVKSMAVYCFTQSIQPGKRGDARAIFEEIRTSRREEYEASRKRLGIREERVWFQSLPDAEMAVVYWEGDDPRGALERFASSDDPFDEWLKERGREVYHFEPGQTLEEDEEVFASSVGGPVSGVTDAVGGVTEPVSGVTDTVRGTTDRLLGGGKEEQR
jgi:hypothetical protein